MIRRILLLAIASVGMLLTACADSVTERTLAPATRTTAPIDIHSLNQVPCPPTLPPGYQLVYCFDFDFIPGVWHGFIVQANSLPNQLSHQYLLLNPTNFTYITPGTPLTYTRSEYTFQPEFNGLVWNDVVRFLLSTTSAPQRMTIAVARALPNAPPTAVPGGPYTGLEGAAVAFDGTASTDPENAPLSYLWDFGDGTLVSGATPTHAYADNGTYQVRLTVNDGTTSHSNVTTATITNVAPSGVPSAPTAVQVGVPFTMSLDATDASSVDAAALQYRFNCGSGFGPVTTTPSATCTQSSAGTYLLRFSVRDKDGATTGYQRAITVSVTNQAPAVTLFSPASVTVAPGVPVTISGAFADGAGDGPWTARAFWGAGQQTTNLGTVTQGQTLTATRIFNVPGTYTARLEVKDIHGATGRSSPVTIVVQ